MARRISPISALALCAVFAAACDRVTSDGGPPAVEPMHDAGARAAGGTGAPSPVAGSGGGGGTPGSASGGGAAAMPTLDAGDDAEPLLVDAGSADAVVAADAGMVDAAADAVGQDAGTSGVPTIVAVGYAGLRVASYDLGRSWQNKRTLSNVAADDPDNLRGVTFGAGLFVAVGHKVFTSVDGDVWEPRQHPQSGQWLGDVKYGNGRFVATGGYGYSAWSRDGATWNKGGSLDTEASRSLAFGNGRFVTQTDPGNWYSSTDGESWSLLSGGHQGRVAFCNGDFHEAADCPPVPFEGTYVRDGNWNSGLVSWSDDGDIWHDVDIGYVGGINDFAFGYTPE